MKLSSQFNFNKNEFASLSTQLNNCEERALVFYKLNDNEKSLEMFKARLKVSKAKMVIVCGKLQTSDARVICLDGDEFKVVQQQALDDFYPVPAKRYLGVTGTNGKTSTIHLLMEILRQNQRRVLSIGTLGVKIDNVVIRNDGLTTPGVCELRRIIFEMKEDFDDVVMEVSSHALHQDRVYGVTFDCVGWTNLSQDHLDYHKDMDSYFQAKLLIKNKLKNHSHFFISDKSLFERIKSYGVEAHKAEDYKSSKVARALSTPFARANLGLAYAMLKSLGLEIKDESKLSPPPGRFQTIEHHGAIAIVDYAHTPDALLNACEGVRLAYPSQKLILVFGCGGDRDKGKRSQMGAIAEENTDVCIVTSDNPRTEDPLAIINDIRQGFKNEPIVELDRKKAIELALKKATADEVVLIAGKGHETYQEINGVKNAFDDYEVVKNIWKLK